MLHLLIGKDWTANRAEIMRRVSADVKARKGGRILMVPELISHETERLLASQAGDTASRYAEVLSFTRLARRVSDSVGGAIECLDKGGRVVAMAAAARQLHSKLKAYASVETKPEFLTQLIDAVDEFKRCCISPSDLKAASEQVEGGFAQKLEELSLIMEAYDSICARGKRDPRDRETQLLMQLEDSDFAQARVFYVDGFPDFTRQHLAILEHLICYAQDVTVSLNCDAVASGRMAFEKAGATAQEILKCANRAGVEVDIQVITGRTDALACVSEHLFQGSIPQAVAKGKLFASCVASKYDECMASAQEVLTLVRDGCRYRDITVVCSDLAGYAPLLRLVFHRMGIPMYEAGMEEVLQKSVIGTVMRALDVILSGFSQKEMLAYLRSALSPLDDDTCDEIENYSIIWGIRGKVWAQEWTMHPDGLSGEWTEEAHERLGRLNATRARVCAPLMRLNKGFQNAKALREQVDALYAFLCDIELEKSLGRLAEEMDAQGDGRSAQILNQLWEIILTALEQLYDVLGDTAWETEHFVHLLTLLLSQYDVGTIPPVLDAVQVGAVSAMRCHEEKHLIVLGVDEGKMPGYSGASGVLSDLERDALREMGVPLTGGSLEGIQAEFAEIYGVFCGATQSVHIYSSAEQPSYIFHRLTDLAGGLQNASDTLGFACADPVEAGAFLAGKREKAIAEAIGAQEAYDATLRRATYAVGSVSHENIKALYGKTLNLSASQIDRYAECRMSYFLKYGLRAQERKEAKIDPAEFGTYVHAVLENTARKVMELGGFHAVTQEQTLTIAHEFSKEYADEHFAGIDSERMQYLFRRNVQELDAVVCELWGELNQSLFAPKAFELGFGKDKELAPIPIENASMQALVRGFIDRTDTWEANGNTYYRVVDYKTGQKELDFCDLFNGVGLQMLIYLFALKKAGKAQLGDVPIPAGMQYFPARVPYLKFDAREDEATIAKKRDEKWVRNGLVLADEQVLSAMQPEGAPKRLGKEEQLVDREQIKLLEDYVFQKLAKMVDGIASGDVTADPYTRGESHDACRFCPYATVCHKESVEGRRDMKKISAKEFWDAVAREVKQNG